MKLRTLFLSLVFLLALSVASVAQAQDDLCFGLSEEDCNVINEAYANTTPTAFTQTFSIDFLMTGLPDTPDIAFSVSGTGPIMLTEGDIPANFEFLPMSVAFTDFATGEAVSADLSVKLVDGVFYIQDPESEEWAGLNLMEALEDPALAGQLGALGVDPATLSDPDAAMEDLPIDPFATLGALTALTDVEGFLTYSRDGDVFTFVADFAPVLASDEFNEALTQLSQDMEDPSIMQLGALAPVLLDNGVITVQQSVTDGVVTGVAFNTALTLNAGMLAGDPEMAPIDISLDFNVNISELGAMFDITAPENAEMIPLGGAMGG